jgi:large subunit ribosomal protein L23
MTRLGEDLNRYGFIVHAKANKLQIKQAVEKMYGVSVASVNTMKYPGKAKSRYTQSGLITGKTKSFKKAVITLEEGDTIDFFSNI